MSHYNFEEGATGSPNKRLKQTILNFKSKVNISIINNNNYYYYYYSLMYNLRERQ